MKNIAIAATTCWLFAFPCGAFADPAAGEEKADKLCLVCHGASVREGRHYTPVLEGQPQAFFIAQIRAYTSGKRTGDTMKTMAGGLSAVDAQDIADFFASRKAGPYPGFDVAKADAGMKALAQLTCRSCHGSEYAGNGSAARLAGQNPMYAASELRSMRSGKRLHPTSDGGDTIKTLTDDDINNVAHALASLN